MQQLRDVAIVLITTRYAWLWLLTTALIAIILGLGGPVWWPLSLSAAALSLSWLSLVLEQTSEDALAIAVLVGLLCSIHAMLGASDGLRVAASSVMVQSCGLLSLLTPLSPQRWFPAWLCLVLIGIKVADPLLLLCAVVAAVPLVATTPLQRRLQ